jgi:YspA, cpYpsA-related SLOG family
MRTIIAGSRNITDYNLLKQVIIESGFNISVVISGNAMGTDFLGEKYAKEFNIPLELYPADWNRYGRSAGPIRNGEMAEKAEALIALNFNNSKGTSNMISQAKSKNLKIYVAEVEQIDNIFKIKSLKHL